ncbi:MAG: GYF domain-containing protein [Polyangiaceae bacterium]
MSGETEWRWADPQGQQRLIRTDELRAALANGVIPPNAPVWRPGWTEWKAAFDVPELTTSALSAANGVVPNIPPPPLFVVAAQTAFEGAPVAPKVGAVGEPPPPPKYVPAPVRAPEAPVPASRPPTSIKTVSGHALGGPPSRPPISQRSAPPISQRMSATEALKRAVPSQPKLPIPTKVAPAAPDTQPDVGASPRRAPEAAGAKASSLTVPTMMGVPRIGDPRASGPPPAPLGAKGPVQTPMMPTVADRVPRAEGGRATLLLDGSAPKTPLPHEGALPPIVAPGSGNAEKNAVTRPPPADHGTVRVGGAGPMRAKEDSSEELSGSMLIEHTDQGPTIGKPSNPPPVPPPRSVKPAPPGLRALASGAPRALSRPPAPPIDAAPKDPASVGSARVPSTPPPVPASAHGSKPATPPPAPVASAPMPPLSAPLPTLMGVGPIPSPGPPPADLLAQIEEPERPSIPDETSRVEAPHPAWLVKLLTRFPQLRPLQKGRPIFFIPVVGGLAALVAFLFLGLLLRGCVSLFSSGDDAKRARRDREIPTASTADTTTPTASPTPTPSATETVATPAPTEAPRPAIPCRGTSVTKVLAPKALVASGVEVISLGKSIGVGFASSPKDGVALELDPSSLVIVGTTKAKGAEIKRVTPLQIGGRLTAAADSDKRDPALASSRTVAAPTPFVLGVHDGSLAWAPRGGAPQNLWSLSGDAPVEALRASSAGAGHVLAFRRGAAVVFGALGAGMRPSGSLVETPGLGPQVGSPSVASSGDVSLVMWADRANADAPWGIRMRRVTSQGAEEPLSFAPSGGLGAPFIAPSVIGLGGRRFFVVWTEGPAQGHQVRGATLDATGQIEGAPFVLSAPGANAGQAQAALADGAKGVVAYLVSSGKGFELHASGVTCAPP